MFSAVSCFKMDDDVVGRVETCLEFVVSQPDAKYSLDSNCRFDVNNACNCDTINEIKLHILEHEGGGNVH